MQSQQVDPEEADARQQILGLMEDRAVASLHEATLNYCERFPESPWGWLISVPNLIDMGRYKAAKKALRKARLFSATRTEAVSDTPATVKSDTEASSVADAVARADAVAQIDPETDAKLCYWSCMIQKDQGNLKRAQRWIEDCLLYTSPSPRDRG